MSSCVRLQPSSENVGSGPSDLTYNNYTRERVKETERGRKEERNAVGPFMKY